MLNGPIVVVVEKRHVVERIAPHLSACWPNRKIFVIATLTFGHFEFRYPRGLRMADFPFIGEPDWRPREFPSEPVWEVEKGVAIHRHTSTASVLQSAGIIVFACDPDARGVMAFHVMLQQHLGESAARVDRPALFLTQISAAAIVRALETPSSTCSSWFESARNAGLARRFFDYNFNINAMALLSQRPNQPLSKYSLQLLFAVRDREVEKARAAINETSLLAMMQCWIGTGKYPPTWLGSPISQAEIIRGLQLQGWLAGAALTTEGRTFLGNLHPDGRDLDLPSRIGEWEKSWPASRPAMERYLRTFFGKQKRYRSHRSDEMMCPGGREKP